ncbi:hypothetical protein DesLBE_1430 [Desulfitobacterium sp. LBE]|uniref:Uncharacterized protein n=2 Tax=root TaxID=1 RepID=A0A098B5K6_DESHA|nr:MULTISPECIES: hypothetical protein [Desulfitobacterium]MEA5022880.1 hypothetical protein [Desulfitobacterium hafniense]TWH57167.1 hypothetical protein DesLBE_1430 [Desulfitobacterium sp. LBE]CDX03632.1 Hypothetical protein DPCES_3746 [Desulfitobacterium hafniense]
MTHSLHRVGPEESFAEDFVFISRPAMGINHVGCTPKVQRTLEIIFEQGPTNLGSLTTQENLTMGIDPQELMAKTEDNSPVMCAFHEREKIVNVLKKLKEEEVGLSVVVTGLVDQVEGICEEVGLEPHSVGISLGVHGATALLPEEEIMCFTTMCGHGMIAAGLVKQVKKAVAEGRMTPEKASKILAKPCYCGIFNQKRAEKLLEQQSAQQS